MISIEEAIRLVDRESFCLAAEKVGIYESRGRVLAENIKADMDLPPFDRSQMDGFAVRSDDTRNPPSHHRIIGESIAGLGFDRPLNKGEAVRIMTGARVPVGADSVQKVELTKENYGFVEIQESTKPGQNINNAASEIKKGAKLFSKGEVITDQMVASLASFGYNEVRVYEQPQVTIFATGSEIVEIDETPQRDQIRNSNSALLYSLATSAGAKAEVLPLVHDDFESLKTHIARAVGLVVEVPISDFRIRGRGRAASKPKIVLLTGGVSVGDYDFTKPALKELGAEVYFEKVALKPGKPTVFARIGNVLIFALPGNPVSVAVTFALFARRAIALAQGLSSPDLRVGHAICSEPIPGAQKRDCFLPVSLRIDDKARLNVEKLRFTGSSNFVAFSRAQALAFIPHGEKLEKGDVAKIFYL